MTSVDDILELIDAGLGDSDEGGWETDLRDYCWRCQDRRAGPSFDGACSECAAWLLGEGEDPLYDASKWVSGPMPETFTGANGASWSSWTICAIEGEGEGEYFMLTGPTIDHGDGIYSSSSGIWTIEDYDEMYRRTMAALGVGTVADPPRYGFWRGP